MLGLFKKVADRLFAPVKRRHVEPIRFIKCYANKRDFMKDYYRDMQRECDALMTEINEMFSSLPFSSDKAPVVVQAKEQPVDKLLIVKDGHIYDESGREYTNIGDLVMAV